MIRKITAGLLLVLLSLTACADPGTTESSNISIETPEPTENSASEEVVYQKITADEAKAMIDDGEDYVLLDVRTAEEFSEQRIDGAILIPDYEIGSRVETELTDKDARILIYCRSGRRSALAANEMIGLGYTNVFDFGGIIDWPYETVSD